MSETPSETPTGTPSEEPEAPPQEKEPVESTHWSSVEPIVSILGTWAWLYAIINGIVYILIGIWGLSLSVTFFGIGLAESIWDIIGGALTIVIGILVIKPRFSDKIKAKDWDYLYNDYLLLGNIKFPWMFIWGIILEITGMGWGGAFVLIPAFLLIFLGPKPYNWTK